LKETGGNGYDGDNEWGLGIGGWQFFLFPNPESRHPYPEKAEIDKKWLVISG